MKTSALRLILLLASLITTRAAFESVGIEMTVEPQLPAVLRMEGIREGRVVFALSVSAEGRLTDSLLLAASHKQLVRPCLEALQEWRFQPARLDGQPVSVGLELEITISQTGAVISRTPIEMLNDFALRITGRPFDYKICSAGQIDGPLVPIKQVNPAYDVQAARAGISGRVRVKFYVDEQGNVRLPTVSSETHPYLSAAAVEALSNWKFAPPTRNGEPVLVAAAQDFVFGNPR